jgi:hypothetical protein
MLAPMKTMLQLDELEIWCRQPIAGTDKAPFAGAVLQAASVKVAEAAKHIEWLDDAYAEPLPAKAKLICTLLAKRSFLNPDSVISEGGIGPIGGDRYVEDMARFLELTEQELVDLASLSPDGEAGGGGLWSQEIDTGRRVATFDDTIYLPDNDPRADYHPLLSTRDFPDLEPGYTV